MKKLKTALLLTATIAALLGCASKHSTEKEESTTDCISTEKIPSSAYEDFYEKENIDIKYLSCFEKGYPDIKFDKKYDKKIKDWKITITAQDGKQFDFYWANGKMLPENQLKNKDKFWSILTYYPKELLDQKSFTPEIIEDIFELGSSKSRIHGKGTPMFFFDAVYDTHNQHDTEEHIARLPLINRWINVHEYLEEPLNRVSKKMFAAAKKDKTVKNFIDSIKVYEAYSWREITGTTRKSFHGLGIAIDALPRDMGKKQIFWSWTKRWNPKTWPVTPLSQRWMPPESVIKIFESEGFAWGGKWVLFDNMHFEYRPELLIYNKIN